MKNMKIAAILVFCAAGLMANQAEMYQGVTPNSNNSIPFHGYIVDSQGRPYYGHASLGFVLYGQEANSPGEELTSSNVKFLYGKDLLRVATVYNGLYATKLSMPPEAISVLSREKDVWAETYLWRGVGGTWSSQWGAVNPDGFITLPPAANRLAPRVQLNSAPFAFSVLGFYYDIQKDMLSVGYRSVNSGAEGIVVSGNVGIGTHNPSRAKLDVNGNVYVQGNIHVEGVVNRDGAAVIYGAAWN